MAARFPGLIALALLALPSAAPAQALPADQVLSGETLRRAGVTRISEIPLVAHRWDVETVDGFTWHASPLGGSPFLPARWTVVVDGRRVDADRFGIVNLDRLGLSLERIATVELVEMPTLVAGGTTTEGLIRITSADPPTGPSARVWFTTGSEIGDPGPFAFTPEATSNVDRLGHAASAELAYGGAGWFVEAAMSWARMVPTDPAIAERYIAAFGPAPRMRSAAPALRAGWRLGDGHHEAVFRHSNVDGALGLSPFGVEIATDERFSQVGLAGELPFSIGGRFRYDVSHTRDAARLRPGASGPRLDWAMGTTEARVELLPEAASIDLAGVRLRRREVRSPAALSDPSVALATAYATLRLGRRREAATASGSVTLGEDDIGLAALLSCGWAVSPAAAIEAVLSHERTSRGEDNTIWGWTERGYDLLEQSGVDFAIHGDPRSANRTGADLRLTTGGAGDVALTARALFRRDRGLSLERRELHFVPASASLDGPTTLVRGAGGELAGASAELASQPAPGLELRASYWVRGAIGGDRVYRDAWAVVPRHGARATMEYLPVPGLELWMGTTYRGPSRRAELRVVEVESKGRYRERLDGAFTVDIGVQKLLWDGRLRAQLAIRNVLAAGLRYHPAGATFGPTAVVQLEGNLP